MSLILESNNQTEQFNLKQNGIIEQVVDKSSEDKDKHKNKDGIDIDLSDTLRIAATDDDYSSTTEQESDTDSIEEERWGSRFSFILAAVGSAVGMGNFWRFPYLVYKWGGGVFFVPYLLAMFIIGIPMLALELSIGQVFQAASVKGFKKLTSGSGTDFSGIGMACAFTSFIICTYYCIIMSWSVVYLVESFFPELPWSLKDGDMKAAENHFINDTLNLSESITETHIVVSKIYAATLFVWVCIYFSLWKGVSATGKVVYLTMLGPIIMLIILLVRGVTLEGASNGIYEYIGKWDMTNLSEGQMWIDAASQIALGLSVASGIMSAYGKFNRPNANVIQDACIIALANACFSFVSGFVVFSIIGYLTTAQGLPFDSLTIGGSGLAFITYPAALSVMDGPDWVANIFCVMFFFTFFLLGIDSGFSYVEGIVSNLEEVKFFAKYSRDTLLLGTCIIGCFLSTLYCSDIGFYMQDLVDYYSSNLCLLSIVFLETFIIGYIHESTYVMEKVGKKAFYIYNIGVPGMFMFLIFLYLLLWEFVSPTIVNGVVFGVGIPVMMACLALAVYFARKDSGLTVKQTLFYLVWHRGHNFARVINFAVTEDGTNNNWRMNHLFTFCITFVIPGITAVLLAVQFQTLARDPYGGFPLPFQLLGSSLLVIVLSLTCSTLIWPKLTFGEEDDCKPHF
eukprot:Awhi_evm1s12905